MTERVSLQSRQVNSFQYHFHSAHLFFVFLVLHIYSHIFIQHLFYISILWDLCLASANINLQVSLTEVHKGARCQEDATH